jgi:hypothetical protein
VSVTSTRWGGIFDHALDLIHPPLWYIAWGIGLDEFNAGVFGLSLGETLGIMVIGYFAGRLAEGFFQWRIAEFSLFIWRPFDSYFRLITARRNPNLLLLIAAAAAGRADIGLTAVMAWTALTSLVLILRLCQAGLKKAHTGPLSPWFLEIGRAVNADALATRLFTRQANVKA